MIHSENGKLIAVCFLFPIFWPFIPLLLIWLACASIRDAYWRWRYPTPSKEYLKRLGINDND